MSLAAHLRQSAAPTTATTEPGGAPRSRRTQQNRRQVEIAALAVLVAHEGEWVGAVAAAEALRVKWRPLAFAFRRMVARGIVQEEIVTYRGTARTKEETRRYRFGEVTSRNPLLPAVHVPPRGVARRVSGRASWGG
ncbi:hypothetical protein [Aromatoleum aromaticum]|uniref:hypothetical protein n=1 Tax=Aromatoleum aromaticum TaxID=551760 RepID=UPI0002F59D11|nr:hypothetical protein [Aromatoleum aromaticum]NMG54227.1 hypothetical protein [Aromatoleum aromaticum]